MTRMDVQPTTVWRWCFRSKAELRKALEEYTALADGEFRHRERDEGEPDPHTVDAGFRIMAQNHEIDRRMLLLGTRAPLYYRLLDVYYRHGLCVEAMGWQVAARRVGLPYRLKISRGRDVTRPQFEVLLDMACTALFHAR